MDARHTDIARRCLHGAHDGTMTFPEIVGSLIAAGFEGYAVDYRRNATTWYRPDGASLALDNPETPGAVAPAFDAAGVAASIREAQAAGPGYTYRGFCEKVKGHGCAGYLVSFPGRRVLYYGRTGETHVEPFPR